jgi:hypothetical protein
LLLVRSGLPPIIIRKERRESYLRAMRHADHGDFAALGQIFARAMEDNLYRFIVPNLAGPAREVPLRSLVTPDLSLSALRQAAQKGRLSAHQNPSGVWRSSKGAVEEYKRSRRRGRQKD